MMKFVMEYTIGNGCSWSSNINRPIQYSSIEDFKKDFNDALEKAIADKSYYFAVGLYSIEREEFDPASKINADEVYYLTLDEWFNQEILDSQNEMQYHR